MKEPIDKLVELLQNLEFNHETDQTSKDVLRTLIGYYHQVNDLKKPLNEHQVGVISRTYYRRIESRKNLTNPFFQGTK